MIYYRWVFINFQVTDMGLQQCQSITVHVPVPPEIRIEPPSATVFRGESLRIRCRLSGIDQQYEQLGYSWTKNKVLFQSDPMNEMWEDLYPDGTILKINNIQVN